MIGMMIVMVLFWGAIIFGAIWLIRGAVGGPPQERKESALDVLERRFVEGAISVEDYRARREVLGNCRIERRPRPGGANDASSMSMKKAIIGVTAVGAVVGLGIVSWRVGHKMRAHFGQMAAHCKQMMAGQFEEQGAPGTRERCEQMAAQFQGHGEAVETREQTHHEAPQFVGQGEAVSAA